jgi:hypothetical protein
MQKVRSAVRRCFFWIQVRRVERMLTLAAADAEIGLLQRLTGSIH